MASLPKDAGTPRRTSVPCATARIHAHTLQENVKRTKPRNQPPQRGMSAHTRSDTQLRKGGGALYNADDLRLVAVDASNQNQTMQEELSSTMTPTQDENRPT